MHCIINSTVVRKKVGSCRWIQRSGVNEVGSRKWDEGVLKVMDPSRFFLLGEFKEMDLSKYRTVI